MTPAVATVLLHIKTVKLKYIGNIYVQMRWGGGGEQK